MSVLRRLPWSRLSLILLAACLLLAPPAVADDEEPGEEIPPLEVAPLRDAKPGEFLRYVEGGSGGWRKWFVERVLDTREGEDGFEVLLEIAQTNEDGTRDITVIRGGWSKVPEFKPAEHQRFIKDEMVVLEVNGQKLNCRHLYIEEYETPPFPDPKVRRHVWYTNDIPCTGKVRESRNNRETLDWGQMSEEETARRRRPYEQREGGEGSEGGDEDDG
jgi:hypothetical protein